ncbi:1-acylglycerol-3-phosphate O-acyltransferase PNPLA3 isoform X3 [Phascolarctos cinereus]|uniref:phospholipase A2 n=1 Tax=Phascolarctos cinereus TaxID=38626 RepID=A0A6P5JZZ3_PHACI|nr:patatin-like phospholipase domain-containing protein 3 isoform X3 [Phascolarctos cinereus]
MAEQMRGWSLSFSGCGFMGFYYVGVTQCLSEHAPQLLRDAPKILGASGGALHCVTFLCGISLEHRLQILMDLVRSARKRNIGVLHPSFNLFTHIRDGLNEILPSNAHKLVSGKVVISLTRVSDGKNVLVSDFDSKEEIIDALVCSCFIPFYCGLIPPTFRGVVLGEICLRGYLDALRFLEEKGICDPSPPCLNVPLEEKEPELTSSCCESESPPTKMQSNNEITPEGTEFIDHLRLSIIPWDDKILRIISPEFYLALQKSLKEKGGYLAKILNCFPVRIISYMMLPCTLPVESVIFVGQRLLRWFPDMPDDLEWLQWAAYKIFRLA